VITGGRDGQDRAMSAPWDAHRTSIGALSVGVGTAGLLAPRPVACLLGVPHAAAAGDAALPLLVRLVAARNIALGAALLATPAPQPRRATEVTLLLTAVDAAAVWSAHRRGELGRRSAVLSSLVLAVAAAGTAYWHRR
jgi:hypothetical protein